MKCELLACVMPALYHVCVYLTGMRCVIYFVFQCLMKEPSITPSGLTYESELLKQHLQRNGTCDPISRWACVELRHFAAKMGCR